jgi:hypothetical protein
MLQHTLQVGQGCFSLPPVPLLPYSLLETKVLVQILNQREGAHKLDKRIVMLRVAGPRAGRVKEKQHGKEGGAAEAGGTIAGDSTYKGGTRTRTWRPPSPVTVIL